MGNVSDDYERRDKRRRRDWEEEEEAMRGEYVSSVLIGFTDCVLFPDWSL